MKNLKQLLGICEHKWLKYKSKINYFGYWNENEERFNATEIICLKCEKCGNLKIKEIPFLK